MIKKIVILAILAATQLGFSESEQNNNIVNTDDSKTIDTLKAITASIGAFSTAVYFHEVGHTLGVLTFTKGRVDRMIALPVGGYTLFYLPRTAKYNFWTASAVILPAHLSDAFLMAVPYDYWYKGTTSFFDSYAKALKIWSSLYPITYISSELFFYYTNKEGSDWAIFNKIWHGKKSYKWDLTLWSIFGLTTWHAYNNKDFLLESWGFHTEPKSKNNVSFSILPDRLQVSYKF